MTRPPLGSTVQVGQPRSSITIYSVSEGMGFLDGTSPRGPSYYT